MRRRALLASAAGLTTLSPLAGCAGFFARRESYPETQESQAEFGSVPCPNIYETEHTICTTPPDDGPPLSLTPDSRTLDLAADGVPAIQITLTNETRDQISLLIRDLREYHDGSWRSLTGWQGSEIPTLAAGETKTWSFSAEVHPTPDGVEPVVYEFQPGLHAFTVAVELTPVVEGYQDVELSCVFEVVDSSGSRS